MNADEKRELSELRQRILRAKSALYGVTKLTADWNAFHVDEQRLPLLTEWMEAATLTLMELNNATVELERRAAKQEREARR